MTNTVRFNVLGPVRAWREGAELDLGSPQQRAVLAVLLFHGGALVTLDELVAAIWDDEPPRTAVGTTRTYVHRLRRVLERDPGKPTLLRSAGGGYAINSRTVDLHDFQQRLDAAAVAEHAGRAAQAAEELDQALAMWNGPALAGVPGRYAEAQRARLAEVRLTTMERRQEIAIALGHHRDAVPELTALVGEHPFRERARQLLMLALAGSGRRADALAVFRDAHRLLADEFGVEPGPELQRIHREILDGEAPGPTPGAGQRSTAVRRRADLAGRAA
ncbi:hypothetical protein Pth03_11330 [Planotetraspora thailandica]|uniref:OmpR/PhoB-type domain-containing protein n=1 Tax=Planotetraspora thailandica TaxID=487172 RepID=A0A8J3XU11_9ACTN|nr:AfsR/SARP family transcriptional regulator [Planotetraspora thailandica]GII52744.1 hypothetical protein Pth03_11330 [Planotetraspora thailandica]